MKTASTILVGSALLLSSAWASAGGLDLRIGGFLPDAKSTLFQDDESLYTRDANPDVGVRPKDWRGITGGAEYNANLGRNLELGFSLDAYGRRLETSYRDYTDESGGEVRQTLKLTTVPLGVTIRLVPGSRYARLTPYLGAGVDLIFYRYEEYGDFIDFRGDYSILSDDFVSEGVAPGVHVAGGIRVALNDDFSLVGEARYQRAKHDMGDDFRGSRIDLSGTSVTLGLHLRF